MSSIRARAVATPAGVAGPTEILVEDGMIADLRPCPSAATMDRLIVPGFVDLQVNGIDDVDIAHAAGSGWERLDELLLAQGTTTWLPTLVSSPLERYSAALARIAAAMSRPGSGRPTIAGVHLEGPFLGGARGAHPERFVIPVDLDWLAALPAWVRLMTLGPEQPAAAAAIRLLRRRDVVVSLGHSRADEAECSAAIEAGASMATHLYNGMGPLHHRQPGIAAVALTDPNVTVGLIVDGVHVHPRMLRLAFAAKAPDRVVVVTDAVAWRSGSVGEIQLARDADGAPRLADGTLAGSAVTMDESFRRLIADCGLDVERAVLATSTNAARLIGFTDRGAITVGARADLVAFDGDLAVKEVWIAGDRAR